MIRTVRFTARRERRQWQDRGGMSTTLHTSRRAALAVVAVLVALAACGSDSKSSTAGSSAPTSSAPAGAGVLPPVMVDLATSNGTTVQVPLGGTINLTGDTSTVTDWSAKIGNPAIVTFVPGRDDGSATFNPGLQATAAGTTTVILSNSSSGATTTFTVNVTG
jgi:hypothetical protein